MKAVLLIGGEATRLRPLTCKTPKAMVPVLNTPFLEHVIRNLGRHGVSDLILTQGKYSQAIEGYFGDGSRFGIRLSYTIEPSPLGTAGAIKNAESFIDGTFLVLNGDVFTDLDITAMIRLHQKHKAKATLALTLVEDVSSYGVIETDASGRVLRFVEKPPRGSVDTNLINAGTYVLEPEVLSNVPPQTPFSFERQVFPQLLERGEPMYAYRSHAYWIDIGTPERYLQLHRDLLSGKGGGEGNSSGGVLIGKQSRVDPTALINGPAVIGAAGSVAAGAVIERSILWDRVKVGRGAVIRDSVIANDCVLEDDCLVEGSVLGDHVTVPRGAKLSPGSKVWPETKVDAVPGEGQRDKCRQSKSA